MRDLLLAFIPLFAAVNPIGTIPIFLSLTEKLDAQGRKRSWRYSIMTAFAVAIVFLFFGKAIFHLLGISVSNFMIAGGILLLVISITNIMIGPVQKEISADSVGVVPLGTPLIAGPATLTTSMILIEQFPLSIVLLALILNLGLAALCLASSEQITKWIGKNGARAIAKIMDLILAAIAVKMILEGIRKFMETL